MGADSAALGQRSAAPAANVWARAHLHHRLRPCLEDDAEHAQRRRQPPQHQPVGELAPQALHARRVRGGGQRLEPHGQGRRASRAAQRQARAQRRRHLTLGGLCSGEVGVVGRQHGRQARV